MQTPQLSLKAKKFLERNTEPVDSEPRQQTGHTTLEKMIHAAQDCGIHPDDINAFCDSHQALLEAAKQMVKAIGELEGHDVEYPTAIKLAQAASLGRAAIKQAQPSLIL